MSSGRSVVIGHGPLPLQSLGVLSEAGFEFAAVISPDAKLRAAGQARGAFSVDHRGRSWSELIERIGPFDYLFSIVNFAILPPELLAAARTLAINYHDGPLPRYAGMNAPFWALWNGETEHGITWHVMVPEVDAGDVLEQPKLVLIGPRDTSFKLNMKCFYAAVRSFRSLVEKLAAGTLERRPQDNSQRSYFDYYARPPALGLLDWSLPASDLDRQLRALDFGEHENRLGAGRIRVGDHFYSLSQAEACEGSGAPGVVIDVSDDHWRVATGRGALALRQMIDRSGARGRPGELEAEVQAGTNLSLAPALYGRLDALDRRLVRSEGLWRQRLQLEPTWPKLPDLGPASLELGASDRTPAERVERCLAKAGSLLSLDKLRVGFSDAALIAAEGLAELDDLLVSRVPLEYDRARPFTEEWARVTRCPLYTRDLVRRTPGLSAPAPPPLSIVSSGDQVRLETGQLGRAFLESLLEPSPRGAP